MSGLGSCYAVDKPSYERDCRHYGPRGDILKYWRILIFCFIILLYLIKGYNFIGLKQYIWEYYDGTTVSVENTTPVSTTVLIVWVRYFGTSHTVLNDATFLTHN